jgi:hypothetical protein
MHLLAEIVRGSVSLLSSDDVLVLHYVSQIGYDSEMKVQQDTMNVLISR